jgi:type II secretory pathway predicted ATPase ExeA
MTRKLTALYGLKWNPFLPEIPDDALMRTPAVDHFCWRVEQQLRDGGFALLTGESGTGKSIALRLLARHLTGLPEVMVGVLNRPQSRLGDFYREMGEVFDLSLAVHNRWNSFRVLREKWEAHLAATLWRPVLLIDEAQEMKPEVLSELRLLSSTNFDSHSVLTVVLCGDGQLLDLFRLPRLIPLGSRIRARLSLEYATPKQLAELLAHLFAQAGNPRLMTGGLVATLCEHAAGNCRMLCNMAAELLTEGLNREVAQLDEKLYLDVFGTSPKSRSRADARRTAG